MRALLDTQVWLWWVLDDPRLGVAARKLVASGAPVLSAVVFWEVAVKVSVDKLDADLDALMAVADRQGVARLGVTEAHVRALARLPLHHRDPFDRMLVAQARAEALPLVTADAQLTDYDVELVAARA